MTLLRYPQKKVIFGLLFVIILAGYVAYYPGVGIDYYEDDYQDVFNQPSSKILYYFFNNNPDKNFYRPIEASFLAFVQTYFGLNTAPIQLTQIGMHALLAWFIFIFILKKRFTFAQATIGSVFFLLSQANAMAVLSNDTLSQIGSTFFGWVSMFSIYLFLENRKSPEGGRQKESKYHIYYIASIAAFLFTLLSKETGISFFLLIAALTLIYATKMGKDGRRKQFLLDILPFLIVLFLFLVIRSVVAKAQPHFGSDRYALHFGSNVVINLIELFALAFIPASSVDFITSILQRHIISMFLFFCSGSILIILTFYNLTKKNNHNLTLLLFGFSVIALFPTFILNHISELYVYNAMPVISILTGLGLGRLYEATNRATTRRAVILCLFAVLLISHVSALRSKAYLMKENGKRATELLNQIKPFLPNIPLDGMLVLVNPSPTDIEYSVFKINGFNVLSRSRRIQQLSNRYDIKVTIINKDNVEKYRGNDFVLILGIEDGMVKKL
jgi:hypothetical protein